MLRLLLIVSTLVGLTLTLGCSTKEVERTTPSLKNRMIDPRKESQ